MAKQIYIDENGNEVLVSGTITDAGNLPLGTDFTDPTSTAGALGDLTTLTTTNKSSLVGAVNEVDADISNRQAYTYRVTNVGSNITIRMKTTSTGEFLYHIVGSVSNGQTFYDSIITGSVSGGAVYCKNIGQNQLGTPIITNNVIKFTVANWSQLLITGLSPVSEITATPT